MPNREVMDISTTTAVSLTASYEQVILLEHNNTDKALEIYTELINQAQEAGDYIVQTDCLIRTSKLNKQRGAYYKALHQGGTALQLIHMHNPGDSQRLALIYKELGAIYADGFGKSSIALNYFFKGLKCNIPSLNINFYNNIGSIYKDMGKYEESLKYLLIGKNMVSSENEDLILAYILENMGGIYTELKDYTRAEQLLLEATNLCEKSAEYDYIGGFVSNTLSNLYLKMDCPAKALNLIESAIVKAKKRNHNSVLVECFKNKSNYALLIGDDPLFIQSVNDAIRFSKEESLSLLQIDCLKLLKNFYWKRKDYQQACKIADQIIDIKSQFDQTREHNSVAELLEKRASEIMVLENKNRRISRQKEELEQFAYIVAHDLKEPVRNIGSYSSLIKRRYADKLDPQGEDFLNFILKGAKHMYRMLEDLLQYATLKDDDETIEEINPNAIIKDIVYRLKDKIESTGTTVKVDALPLTPIRPIHLSVLVENLIKNAIKFRLPDRPLLIHISAKETKKDICFCVSDNGCGIDPKFHQAIFQIFKRLEKDKYAGTGIGLSICKKIVEVYKGKIWVNSNTDEGSTFYFKISR